MILVCGECILYELNCGPRIELWRRQIWNRNRSIYKFDFIFGYHYHDHRSLFKLDNFLPRQVVVLLAMCWETIITMKEGLEASSAVDESLLVKSAIVLMLGVIDEQNQSYIL